MLTHTDCSFKVKENFIFKVQLSFIGFLPHTNDVVKETKSVSGNDKSSRKLIFQEKKSLLEKQNPNEGISSSLFVRLVMVPDQKEQMMMAYFAFIIAKNWKRIWCYLLFLLLEKLCWSKWSPVLKRRKVGPAEQSKRN